MRTPATCAVPVGWSAWDEENHRLCSRGWRTADTSCGAVLEHLRKGETLNCMALPPGVPGLFRFAGGQVKSRRQGSLRGRIQSPPRPSPFSPRPPNPRVTGSPVPRCSGLEKQPNPGIPQLLAEVNWTPRPLYVIVQYTPLLISVMVTLDDFRPVSSVFIFQRCG